MDIGQKLMMFDDIIEAQVNFLQIKKGAGET